MADASSVNENVAAITPGTTDTGLYAVWRLTRVLVAAGWTIAQSSNGTSFGASDYWSTMTGLGSGAWIILTGPGSRQFCFWRDTAGSLWAGKVIYSKSGGHTFASASATNPGTLPATAQYMRGAVGSFVSWFGGGTKAIKYVHVLAKDVTDGSFWIMGTTPGTATDSFYHMFGFFSLQTIDAADTDPYILYCPAGGPTSDTATNMYASVMSFSSQDTSGTSGYWWGWARNAAWKPFSPIYENLMTTVDDVDPYTLGQPPVFLPVQVGKFESAFRERKGFVRYARYASFGNASFGMPPLSDPSGAFKWVHTGYNWITPYPLVFLWWDPTATTMGMTV